MAELKLNRINKGDSQKVFTNKINVNFSELTASFGGPYGKDGLIGIPGQQGPVGPIGAKGLMGPRGAKWFLLPDKPTSDVQEGDYWMSSVDHNKVYQLISGEWIYQNLDIKANEQFKRVFGVAGPESRDAIIQSSSNPETNTLVLNSAVPAQDTLNPQYSRMVVETSPGATFSYNPAGQPLIEFSKTNNGATGDYDKSVVFLWDSYNTDAYDLSFNVRRGGMDFNIGGNLDMFSNTGSVKLRSEKDGIVFQVGGLSINTTGDYYFRDVSDAGMENVKINTPNFKLGDGPSTNRDFGTINSPMSVTKYTDGYDKPAMEVRNYTYSRGDGIHVAAEYSSGNGYLWTSNTDSASLLRLTKDGELKISRKMGIRKNPSPAATESHGTYSGTTYNWYGIFPSPITTGSDGAGRIDWDGDEDMVINTSGVANRALYINMYWICRHFLAVGQSLSLSVKTADDSQVFSAIGLSVGQTVTTYYPDSSKANQFAVLANPAFVVDLHIIRHEDSEEGYHYTIFYEARGTSEDESETGVIYSNPIT